MRSLTLGLILSGGLCVIGGAALAPQEPAYAAVTAGEADAVRGAACSNISEIFDGCTPNCAACKVYSFDGDCYSYVSNHNDCAAQATCGQYQKLNDCERSR